LRAYYSSPHLNAKILPKAHRYLKLRAQRNFLFRDPESSVTAHTGISMKEIHKIIGGGCGGREDGP
ncbi:MAG: hypothetical protein ACPHRO_12595, partial [Nannocystaceae bacterium]